MILPARLNYLSTGAELAGTDSLQSNIAKSTLSLHVMQVEKLSASVVIINQRRYYQCRYYSLSILAR